MVRNYERLEQYAQVNYINLSSLYWTKHFIFRLFLRKELQWIIYAHLSNNKFTNSGYKKLHCVKYGIIESASKVHIQDIDDAGIFRGPRLYQELEQHTVFWEDILFSQG